MGFLIGQIKKRKEIVKYIISGGSAALVNFSLLYFFTDILGIWYLLSSVLSFVVSFFVSFYLQKFWTFSDKNKKVLRKQMVIYLFMALFNLTLNTVSMYILVDLFKIWYMLAQFFITATIALWNFIVYKFFIFNQKTPADETINNVQRLKILIATGIYPPDLGGPATLLTRLPAALKEKGLGIKVITYSDVALSERERQEGMVYRIRRHFFFYKLLYFWRLCRLSFRADMIYATDTYSVGYFAYLIKKLTGKKYIIRFAGDSAWETAVAAGWTEDYIVDFQKKKYDSRIEKLKQRRTKILINADKVVAVSNFIADVVKIIGVQAAKISVIYNAVDFFGEAPAKSQPPFPTLVFAGRLMPWKGVEMMLRVAARLKTRWPEIIFEVLGDGPQDRHLKEMARQLGIENNVKFRGRVSEEQSHAIFARSTIFVLNTNYEGLPHSVLNAMRAGLPIITTAIGGNIEVVQNGENGILVPYNDERAWEEAISRLLTDESLQNKFIQNSRKTLEGFKWDRLVEETVALLQDTITKRQETNNN